MAGTYNSNIPAPLPLADPNAQALVPLAPVIAAGAPRNINDVTNAMQETSGRKRQKIINNASVTDAEVSYSAARQVAVTAEYAEGVYGAVGAPGWAQPLFAQLNAVQAQLNAGQAQLNAVQAQLNAGHAQLNKVHAMQRLNAAQRRNHRNANAGGLNPQLIPLVKVIAGVGPPTPGQPPAVPAVAVAPVGAVYPATIAPANKNELDSMTLAQISQLAEWANDHFGIVVADNVRQRRNKLHNHYMFE